MIAIAVALLAYFRIVRNAMADPAVRGLMVVMTMVITVGTLAYHWMEEWSLLNAAYFSVVSLLTVGYGDYVPTSDGAKLFTIGYLLTGVGIIASAATTIIQRSRLWVRFDDEVKEEDAKDGEPG